MLTNATTLVHRCGACAYLLALVLAISVAARAQCPGGDVQVGFLTSIGAQAAILSSTQRQETYQGGLVLSNHWNKTSCGWPHQRTLLDLKASYDGKKSDTSRLNITRNYSAKVQQLAFLVNNKYYISGNAGIYHNNSLGMYLQQGYGIGGGALLFNQTLEVSADIRGVGEHFLKGKPSLQLWGSLLTERYVLSLAKITAGASLSETISFLVPFDERDAWQMNSDITMTLPINKKFSVTASAFDDYIRNAPIGFRRNYLKATFGFQFNIP